MGIAGPKGAWPKWPNGKHAYCWASCGVLRPGSTRKIYRLVIMIDHRAKYNNPSDNG